MSSSLTQLWVPTVVLLLGMTAGWMGRKYYAVAEIRRLIDRLLLLDNELRSARAALVRERQMRLAAQTALRHVEQDRDSLAALAGGGERLERELEDLLIEVVEEPIEAEPASTEESMFSAFTGGALSAPPPRTSDVRELRSDRSKEEITRRAYELWDAAGRPTGQDEHFWYLAEQELIAPEWRAAAGQ
jgi:Protein of unknown function (DUF2934)